MIRQVMFSVALAVSSAMAQSKQPANCSDFVPSYIGHLAKQGYNLIEADVLKEEGDYILAMMLVSNRSAMFLGVTDSFAVLAKILRHNVKLIARCTRGSDTLYIAQSERPL